MTSSPCTQPSFPHKHSQNSKFLATGSHNSSAELHIRCHSQRHRIWRESDCRRVPMGRRQAHCIRRASTWSGYLAVYGTPSSRYRRTCNGLKTVPSTRIKELDCGGLTDVPTRECLQKAELFELDIQLTEWDNNCRPESSFPRDDWPAMWSIAA